jgi:hypothetical protein
LCGGAAEVEIVLAGTTSKMPAQLDRCAGLITTFA